MAKTVKQSWALGTNRRRRDSSRDSMKETKTERGHYHHHHHHDARPHHHHHLLFHLHHVHPHAALTKNRKLRQCLLHCWLQFCEICDARRQLQAGRVLQRGGGMCNKKLQIVWGIAVYEGARSSCTFFVAKKNKKKWHKRICWHYAQLEALRYTRYWLQWLR